LKAQGLIDVAKLRAMKAQSLGATAVAKLLGIGRASGYRALEAARKNTPALSLAAWLHLQSKLPLTHAA
jgi:hypothetical protein